MAIIVADEKVHIATNTTTVVNNGPCKLKNIVINTAAAGAITIVDNVAGQTTPVVAIIKASAAEGTYVYNCVMNKGIQIITAGATDITVTWNI